MSKITDYLSLIKFTHTVFALPFAFVGWAWGVHEVGFEWSVLFYVFMCMLFARSAAMAFNRLVDRRFDAANPRTAQREIPRGAISVRHAGWFVWAMIVGFLAAAFLLNWLALALSPVALAVVLGYSYLKRYTAWCHVVLGLGLAIAPVGAYIAVTGQFSAMVLMLSALVLTWTAGFDIIFALQDVDFDRSAGLHSVPAHFGVKQGLVVSALLHVVTAAAVVSVGVLFLNNAIYWCGAAVFGAMLVYQHAIVRPGDLSRVNLAFGTTNGIASVVYGALTITSMFVG